MAVQYGIKLWSINHDLFPEAAERYAAQEFDFIELYIVPGKVDLKALDPIKHIPFTIHAPHENHGFNVFTLAQQTVDMFKRDVVSTADALNASRIVVHGGVGDTVEEYVKNFARINDPRIIIENMPKLALDGTTCFAYSLNQLQAILTQTKMELCMDVCHATKSAVSQKLSYKDYFTSLLSSFSPKYFHLSDGIISNERDDFLNLGDGDYDISWMKRTILDHAGNEIAFVFEVPKVGNSLQNDIDNIERFKQL